RALEVQALVGDLGLDRDSWRELREAREDDAHAAVERAPEISVPGCDRGDRPRGNRTRERRAVEVARGRAALESRVALLAQPAYAFGSGLEPAAREAVRPVRVEERGRDGALGRFGVTREQQIVTRLRRSHRRLADGRALPDRAHLEVVGGDDAAEPELIAQAVFDDRA